MARFAVLDRSCGRFAAIDRGAVVAAADQRNQLSKAVGICNQQAKSKRMSKQWLQPAFLNGTFMPLQEARVSVLDRGFLFGDGVYELIPVYERRLFRLGAHLDRLARSLKEVQIANPYQDEHWRRILRDLISRASDSDLSVYLQITRGVAPRDHGFPQHVEPTVFIMASPLVAADPQQLVNGVAAVTFEDVRWRRCDIKSVSLLGNVLLRQRALDNGAAEAILIRDGFATEGAASNLFIVRQGRIKTPPQGTDLLAGITRETILELAGLHGIPCLEEAIPHADLFTAEEIWLTSSSKEVLPVTRLNGDRVGNGLPGPLWKRVHQLLQALKHTPEI